jgi:hypothetical protein
MRLLTLVAILLVVSAQLLSAQSQGLTKEEYALLAFGALAKSEAESRRVKTTYIYQNSAEAGDILSDSVEYQPRTHKRSVTVRKTAKGTTQEEIIEADGREFVRKGTGRWKEKKDGYAATRNFVGAGTAISRPVSSDSRRQETTVFRHIGIEVVDQEETQMIEKIWTIVETSDSAKRVSEFLERVWIQKDGRVKKQESRSSDNGKAWSHTVSVFEYDPSITVDIPPGMARRSK